MQRHSRWHNPRTTLGLAILLAAGLQACSCRSEPPAERAAPREMREVLATVRRFPADSAGFVLVTADSAAVAYRATPLPIPFRIDGLQVVFSGRLAASPRDPSQFGVPLVLTAIRRADAAVPSY